MISSHQVANSWARRTEAQHNPDGLAGTLEKQEQLRELLTCCEMRDSSPSICPGCTWNLPTTQTEVGGGHHRSVVGGP